MKRVLHKARHPRTKGHGHDALLGDLVRTHPAGAAAGGGGKGGSGSSEQLLDSCSGTWLTELVWDKVGCTGLVADWAEGAGGAEGAYGDI